MSDSTKSNSLDFVSLFSGAMGLDLGLEAAGMRTAVAVEFDRWACETITTNRPETPTLEKDIGLLESKDIMEAAQLAPGAVSLVVGGPPCQAFSSAGKRRSIADGRGNVILAYLRTIGDLQPDYFVLENVRGLLSSVMGTVPSGFSRQEYADLIDTPGSLIWFLTQEFQRMGYSVSFGLLNAANYGVPQKRERVVMIGSSTSRVPLPRPTHSDLDVDGTAPWTDLRSALVGLPEDPCEFRALSESKARLIAMLGPGQYWKDLPPQLHEEAMGKSLKLGGGKTGFYRRLSWDKPSPTLVTCPTMPATMLAHPDEVRPLSVQDYSRIQGFPDSWDFQGNLTQRYRQIGNAVPVGLGCAIGRAIFAHMAGEFVENQDHDYTVPFSRYKNTCDWEFLPLFEERANLLSSQMSF